MGSFFTLTALAVAEGSFFAHCARCGGGGLFSRDPAVGARREWWACLDLNQGPSGYEPVALTTELQALRFNSSAPRGSP